MEQVSNLLLASMKASTLGEWMLEGFNPQTVKLLNCYFNYACQFEGNNSVKDLANVLTSVSMEKLQTSWSQSFCVGPRCLPPEESVVKAGLSMQEFSDLSRGWFQRFGQKSAVNVPPDHLGVQLYFLSFLLSNAADNSDKENICSLAGQFIKERLSWVEDLREQFKNKAQDEDLALILPFVELAAAYVKETEELLKAELVQKN